MNVAEALKKVEGGDVAVAIDGKGLSVLKLRKVNGFNRVQVKYVSDNYEEAYVFVDTPERLKDLNWLII